MDLADADDADLVAALRRDPAAVEEFYRRHVRALTRYAQRRLDDPHDLVAATFLAAIESAHRFDRHRGQPVAWLFGIANKLLLGQLRRAAAERRALDRLGGQRPLDPDEYGRLEDAIDARRRAGPAALATLPAAERELLVLVLEESLTVGEAAEALGLRPGAARMRLSRARARLMVLLGAQR